MKQLMSGVLVVLLAVVGRAATCTWTGEAGDGQWNTAGNWSGKAKPTSSDTVVLSSAGLPTDADGVPTLMCGTNVTVSKLRIPNGTGSFRLKGSQLTISAYVAPATATLTYDGASVSCAAAGAKIEIANAIYITGQRGIFLDANTDLTFSGDFSAASGIKPQFLKQGPASSKFTLSGAVLYAGNSETAGYSNVVFHVRGGTNVLSAAALGKAGSQFKVSATSGTVLVFGAGVSQGNLEIKGTEGEGWSIPSLPMMFSGDVTFNGSIQILHPIRYGMTWEASGTCTFASDFSCPRDITGGFTLRGTGAHYVFERGLDCQSIDRLYMDTVDGSATFNGPFKGVASFNDNDKGARSTVYLNGSCPIGDVYARTYNVVLGSDDVLTGTPTLRWGYTSSAVQGVFDLNGHNQTVKSFSTGAVDAYSGRIVKSDAPATLTIRPTSDVSVDQPTRSAGALSMVFDPQAAVAYALTDHMSTMTGDLIVRSGTLSLSGTKTSFAKVASVQVADGASLVVDESAKGFLGAQPPLLDIGSGSHVCVPSALDLKTVKVDGEYLGGGRYQAQDGTDATAEKVDWLTGGGVLTVSPGAYWKKSVISGEWGVGENWNGDLPGAAVPAYAINEGADYAIRVTSPVETGSIALRNDGTHQTNLAVSNSLVVSDAATVTLEKGGRIQVGEGGSLSYNSYDRNGDTFMVSTGGAFELDGAAEVRLATQTGACAPIKQFGGDIVAGGTSKLTLEGAQNVYLGSGKTTLKDSAVLETVTGKDKSGKALNSLRFYTQTTVAGVTNHLVMKDQACIQPKDNVNANLDQVIFGYPNSATDGLFRFDYGSEARSFFGNQIELGATWGYAEMNVTAGLVAVGAYGIGVGGFHYDSRLATDANVVGVLNVSGGAVDVNASSFSFTKNRVRGLLLGEGWYDKKTATSKNLFTGYVNLSDGVISNRYGAVILGAGAAKGVWTQTGGAFVNDSAQTKGPMILGWLGGEGTYILSNGTVNVSSANVATYVGGAETNLTPWVLEAQAPSSADAARGLLSLQGGIFTTAGDVVVGQDGDGTIEVGANGRLSARSLELKVAAATAEKPAHSSTLKFTAGGRITLTGAFKSVADAQLEFDLTDWDKSTRLRFISCNGLEGTAVDWNNVSFTGVDKSDFSNAGGLKYVFRQTAHGIAVGKASGIAIIVR